MLAQDTDNRGLNFNDNPFVASALRLFIFKFDECDSRCHTIGRLRASAPKTDTAKTFEAPPLAAARHNGFEITVFAYQDCIGVLRSLCHDGIGRVRGNNGTAADNDMAARFKKLADRFRHTLVSEKP